MDRSRTKKPSAAEAWRALPEQIKRWQIREWGREARQLERTGFYEKAEVLHAAIAVLREALKGRSDG